jgi:hypothetical protein
MIKDLKWMLFGGIKWRFRGFLIGLTVGFLLGSMGFSGIRDALADESMFEFVPDDSQTMDGYCNRDYVVQGIQVDDTGYLTSIDVYAQATYNQSITVSADLYYEEAGWIGALVETWTGVSAYNTGVVGIDTDWDPLATYTLDWDLSTPFPVDAGERFYLVLTTEACDNPSILHWATTAYDYVGNWGFCTALTDSSYCNEFPDSEVLSFTLNYSPDPLNSDPTLFIDQGPYYKSDWSAEPSGYYSLGYNCTEAGTIELYSEALGDSAYYEYGECDPADSWGGVGTMLLELDTGTQTDYGIRFYDEYAILTTQYDILIQHDDIWSTYVSEGGDAEDENIVASAFGYIWEALTDVPVVGDALALNSLIWSDFIGNLGSSDVAVLDIDSDFLGENYDVTLDFYDVIDDLQAEIDDNPNYESFRILMTTLFWALMIFGVVRSFTHKSDEDGV